MKPGASGHPSSPRRFWRENIEAVVMAIVMAILLKYFVIEAYKIPTGSMQPTLIGDAKAGVQDRILVDKLAYVVDDPRRWDVCVFRYPLDHSKSFVKRLVGIGPETLKIEYGDVWARKEGEPWTVLQRPRRVQRSTWKRIDWVVPPDRRWEVVAEVRPGGWNVDGPNVRASGTGTVAFLGARQSIVDDYLHGYPPSLLGRITGVGRPTGNNTVGDLRIEGKVVALPGTELVEIVLTEGARRYSFRIPGPAAHEGAAPSISRGDLGGERVRGAPYRLPPGQAVAFAAQNLDDRLELEVAGEPAIEVPVDPAVVQESAIYLSLRGEGGRFLDLAPYRDIYYTPGDARTVEIPAGSYFMLGDNTQESSDSREWRYCVLELQDGQVLRGNLRRGENPRLVGAGDPDGPKTYFVDEWGEPHWLRSGSIQRRTILAAPFVPRRLLQGRALAVFWPLSPREELYRLRWVN